MNYQLRNIISILSMLILSAAASTNLERWAVEPQYSYFENKVGTFIENLQFKTVSGEEGCLYDENTQLTVVAVFDVDCPLSLKLIPTMRSIESAFPDVTFKHISFSKLVSKEEVLTEFNRRKFKGELLFDEKAYLPTKLKVKTTCEVFVIDSKGTLKYRGAIDDQYGINAIKAQPEKHYLKDALVALKTGKAVNYKLTGAPGCLVDSEEAPTQKTEITYHKDISRIFQNKCQQCHHKGGVGPFELMTYAQAKERRKMIKYVIKKDLMPPWFAEEGGPWLHNYDLTEGEKTILMTWLENGTPEGDKADAPVAKKWSIGHKIENPDLVVKFPKVAVKAEGLMNYQNPIVKVPIKEGKWIKRMEVRTENPQVLHHALFFLTNGKANRGAAVRGFFAGYVPGTAINEFPEGTGKYLPAGTHLHVQLHYTPNGTAVKDQVSIAFEFMDEPPKYKIETSSAFNVRLKIPPHEPNYVSKAQHTFHKDGYLVGFNPHAHTRGKAFKYELQRKGGGVEALINIPKYDYNWQINYQLQKPIKVMKGDKLNVTAIYDNSESNKSNPDPTVTVRFGEQTNDEMMIGYFEWYEDPNQTLSDDMGIPKELRIMAEKVVTQVKSGQMSIKKARGTLIVKAKKSIQAGELSKQDAMNYFKQLVDQMKR